MDHIDVGLLLLRLVFGSVIIAHGCRKLFGWFSGAGVEKAAAMFDSIGYRPGKVLVMVASGTEILAGLMLLTGLLWPLGPMMAVGTMLVAASTHWANGFWSSKGGMEQPFSYAVVAAGLLFTGPGEISLPDGIDFEVTLPMRAVALLLALGGAAVLMTYRTARIRRDRVHREHC